MAAYTLDSIREQADAKYQGIVIEFGDKDEVELLNPMRLKAATRTKLTKVQEELNSALSTEDEDEKALAEDAAPDLMADIIRLVAKDAKAVNRLLDEIDGDMATMFMVFEMYTKGTQAGEASASHD